jgi:alkanesulfonate monooxygenase SsuD/methylene tetrahydromethanopterin reductase-like flavin-dependent oxidoreductase (luciferase family)
LFPGRVLPGVGHGTQRWMAQVGAQAESPLTLLREYTGALRALLAGQEVTTSGRYVRLDRVQLEWPPASPLPVLAGAIGPRSVRLSGECSDGTILTCSTTSDGVRTARALIDEGRADAGRSDPHAVIVFMHAATGPGAAVRLARERELWHEDPDGDFGAAGDAATVAEAVKRWAGAGATTVVLQPTTDDPDPEGFARFVGREVRPLIAP